MKNASSARFALSRSGRAASVCTAAVVSLALLVPTASAETLDDLKAQAEQTKQGQVEAQAEIAEGTQKVTAATTALTESQSRLDAARARLADIGVQLAAARETDAQLTDALVQARAQLALAKERVAAAQTKVDAQVALIGAAARETFQQRSDLQGLSVVFGSQTPAQMSQRIQWATTIFDTQAAEKAHLDEVTAELSAARDTQASIETRIENDKAASARTVARISGLEGEAKAQESVVEGLVAENTQARAAAQSELDADEAAYAQLKADEQKLQGEISAEIARLRAEEQKRKEAEERQRREAEAKERREAEAAAAAAAAKAKAAGKPAPAPVAPAAPKASAPRETASSRSAGRAVSAYGFIRPVNANPGSRFGMRFHPILHYWRMHNGVDYGAPTGTPLYAAKAGTVMKAGPNGGFGNFVLIGHGDMNGRYVTTGYAHMNSIIVRPGQRVEQGQLIGYVGNTGLSTTPHLHFEVRLDGVPVNPLIYVP